MNIAWKKSAGRFALLTAAPLIYGAGISLFLDPNHLAPGGMTGISVMGAGGRKKRYGKDFF